MVCLEVDPVTGDFRAVDPQPADFSSCTYVLQSGAEVVASPFALDQQSAIDLCIAFACLWSLAWGIRLLKRQLMEG